MSHAVFLLSLLCPGAQDEPSQEVIAGLIESLDSRSIEERDKAGMELLRLGKITVPQLKTAGGSDDPEVALRAQHLVYELSVTRTAVVRTVARLLERAFMAFYKGRYASSRNMCDFIAILDPSYSIPIELTQLMKDDRYKVKSPKFRLNLIMPWIETTAPDGDPTVPWQAKLMTPRRSRWDRFIRRFSEENSQMGQTFTNYLRDL